MVTRRHLGRLGAGLVIALAATACGGTTATPSPSPSPTAISTPTPAPTTDVAGAFLRQMILPTASATGPMRGSIVVAGIEVPIEGSIRFRGSDSHMTFVADTPTGRQTTDVLAIGTRAWTRQSPGPWLVQPPSPDGAASVTAMLKTLAALEDRGVETWNGREVHRLRPTSDTEIGPEAFGFTDPSISDTTIDVDFLAELDGTPAAMVLHATWNQLVGGLLLPVTMDLEFEFGDWGSTVSMEVPDDVWVVHTSADLGYSMAHPADWTVERDSDGDGYAVDGIFYIFVLPLDIPAGMTTDQLRDSVVTQYHSEIGGPPESDEAVTLGGQPAHRLTYHVETDDGTTALFDYLTVRGDMGWEVVLYTIAGPGELDDLAFFETFIATFAFID